MPYWGLVATSTGFLFPGFWAWRRRAWVDAVASAAVTVSSLAYHGTRHRVAQAVDMAIAHTCGVVGVTRSVWLVVRRRRARQPTARTAAPLAVMLAGIGVYVFKSRSNHTPMSARWHMVFHVCSQWAWTSHVRGAEAAAQA